MKDRFGSVASTSSYGVHPGSQEEPTPQLTFQEVALDPSERSPSECSWVLLRCIVVFVVEFQCGLISL
ncbi:hypothetical protein DY000_02042828 [Brassica cretica]|uniref:Uncharacterized protein n=1 Tax=Brassica cretica TaxID=69181 RepID=A0ABQ7BPT6_BRACR|nr:hypothetical protein DY000_02042828 [Brassica cretica]